MEILFGRTIAEIMRGFKAVLLWPVMVLIYGNFYNKFAVRLDFKWAKFSHNLNTLYRIIFASVMGRLWALKGWCGFFQLFKNFIKTRYWNILLCYHLAPNSYNNHPYNFTKTKRPLNFYYLRVVGALLSVGEV